ncbi:unnamed protein product [Cylindrotheca closterium]|uniref:Condensin complex subunit 2 n=1 Tax=Cylindrotheca closterium TaxID=2856 RepID=A0AAD2CKW1_9STRA|nr:unnamed protein product [Cylindrotheca closterium]
METISVFDDKTNQHQAMLFDDDDQDHLAEDEEASVTLSKKLQDRRRKAKNRRRRRSSARFLNLGTEDDEQEPISSANLGEVYQNAIRMNAENKINAANSWNLNLIDHLDQFVSTNGREEDAGVSSISDNLQKLSLGPDDAGVNFTKASCTLDASVKIYAYRVDDVHLTSYKVLANLNRTETGKNKKKDDNAASAKSKNLNNEATSNNAGKRKVSETETLEQNLANINIAKLDEAFDIDPLFHKMSKTFDEGGAKGLLLANLGVSNNGCNIVFDSTLEERNEMDVREDQANGLAKEVDSVDVISLNQKLEASLEGQPLFLMQLVPQLASLREEYSQLKQDGFVDKLLPSSLRYAAPKEDEIEADKSIHMEAIERSRVSQAGQSLLAKDQEDDPSLNMDDGNSDFVDFGAGNDFGGDDDHDDNLLGDSTIHDGNHRYSSSSFQASYEGSQEPSQAVVLLDAIANGDISGSQSNYEYFNSQALSQIQGNMWAGAAHWKKQAKKSGKKAPTKKKAGDGKRKPSASKSRKKKINIHDLILDLRTPVEDLEDLMRQPPKGKKGVDPLQITKATNTKYSNNDNLLPIDLGLTVQDFDSFFLRPQDKVSSYRGRQAASTLGKQVAFAHGGGNDDVSFGGDSDGPGFDFGGDDEDHDEDGGFIVPELEGVRKIEKIQVGYATKAKKVDVKRLKKDLWEELERSFADKRKVETDSNKPKEVDTSEGEENEERDTPMGAIEGSLSFQSTVKEMQSTQTQSDATLPFFFICVLHLANEKGLALESTGLEDFIIHTS